MKLPSMKRRMTLKQRIENEWIDVDDCCCYCSMLLRSRLMLMIAARAIGDIPVPKVWPMIYRMIRERMIMMNSVYQVVADGEWVV
jgi:hypothetical protein